MEAENSYVLAMYDVRGKQDYIFRGHYMKEIIGGSLIIRDVFKDYLYPAAKAYRDREKPSDHEAIFDYKKEPDSAFNREHFIKRMESGDYLGEVVYDGGGNFLVLYKDRRTAVEINKIFTKRVLESTDTLKVLCTILEHVDFDNYNGDNAKLYKLHEGLEAKETPQMPSQVLPFTMTDYETSQPIIGRRVYTTTQDGNKLLRNVTKEADRKYRKYNKTVDSMTGEKILDELVRDTRGDNSLLAIVYIDGNNMGAKVMRCKESAASPSYEDCVAKLREFSEDIQTHYIDKRIQAIDRCLKEKYNDERKRRIVVYAGDEINFICRAVDAYDLVKAYFEGLKPEEGYSACAGIAVFHSHAPYADAYRIAEEACETGKTLMKKWGISDANLMDMQYCQSGIGVDLEHIREKETGELNDDGIYASKPWFISNVRDARGVTISMVEQMVCELNKVTRTNVKPLIDASMKSQSELETELERMKVRAKGTKPDFDIMNGAGQPISSDMKRKMIYDIALFYDLWFRNFGQTTIEKGEH